MDRLTTNKPHKGMEMFERAHNDVYIQDGEAWYRDHNTKVPCRDVVRHIFTEREIDPGEKFFKEDDCFEEYMYDLLQYGFNTLEGIIAILYQQMWSKCNLRERLKEYEDTGLTPEQIKDIDRLYTEKCKELGEVKDSRNKSNWIPCNERLPNVGEYGYGDFIVTIKGASEATALTYYDSNKSWTDGIGNYYEVIAWKPFPEVYKENSEAAKR